VSVTPNLVTQYESREHRLDAILTANVGNRDPSVRVMSEQEVVHVSVIKIDFLPKVKLEVVGPDAI